MDRLAIFDVDFTITKKETMVELLKYYIKKYPYRFYYAFRSLTGFLLYSLGIIDEKKSKEMHLRFLEKFDEEALKNFIDGYYENQLSKVLLKDGINEIKKRKNEGYRVILSSASPEIYLKHLYDISEVEKIFGSRFESNQGRFKSKMIGENNKGEEKVRRLKEYLDLSKIDLENSIMYSDSLSDKPLLNLVGKGYLINWKHKDSDFEILKWK